MVICSLFLSAVSLDEASILCYHQCLSSFVFWVGRMRPLFLSLKVPKDTDIICPNHSRRDARLRDICP
jgi:hypothetical protein